MRYADSIHSTAIALSPSLWLDSRKASFTTSGTLSRFSSDGWSAQGSAQGSVFSARRGLFLGEIEGNAGGSAHDDASRTGQVLAIARGHLVTDSQGAWLGAGIGSTWDGITWRGVKQGEIAAWIQRGPGSASLSVTPIIVDDSIKYTDAQLAGALNLTRFDVNASAGVRGGSRLPTPGGTARSWGSVSVTGWILSRLAIVASAGTYPVDLTQGFPGGRFASLSVRLGSRRFTPSNTPSLEADGRRGIEVRKSGALREIRVKAPSAKSVELMGDFTDWSPVSLESIGEGWWVVKLPIKPGIHELNVRFDKGTWAAPHGLPRKSDEFGGSVGILVIEM